MKTSHFFYYHAGRLAIDSDRPWQLCSRIGAVCGQFKREDSARTAIEALQADKDAGSLPVNLSEWPKRHLLRD